MRHRLNALMTDILNTQPEVEDETVLAAADQRFQAYMRGRGDLSEADRRLVWTSPGARSRYLDARRAVAEEVRGQWSSRGFQDKFALRAADTDSNEYVVSDASMTLRILRVPGMNDWLISVVFSPEAAGLLPRTLNVRLIDSGGRLWVEGTPDRAGGLDAYWDDPVESPVERLRSHSLRLDFR